MQGGGRVLLGFVVTRLLAPCRGAQGVVYGHAYSILRVVEESDDAGTHQLVQLR
jgi:hypothetical protein